MSRAAAAAGGGPAAGEYRAAHDTAILVDRRDVAALRVTGTDAIDLLHRLSTNDLKAIPEGGGAPTVFTTAKGRILALASVHRAGGALHLLLDARRAGTIRDWIDRYTFREEVRVESLLESHRTLGLCGPQATGIVARAFPGVAGLPPHGAAEAAVGAETALLARTFPLAGDAWLVSVPSAAADAVRARLLAAGAGSLVTASFDTLETLRIEAGLPAADRELTEDHNPWEARLDDAVSLAKGCYVGQEVIARLNTYRKVARLLVRLESEGREPLPGGAAVFSNGETIGEVTSSAVLPERERVIALAYVRDEDAVEGRHVSVAEAAGQRDAVILGPAR